MYTTSSVTVSHREHSRNTNDDLSTARRKATREMIKCLHCPLKPVISEEKEAVPGSQSPRIGHGPPPSRSVPHTRFGWMLDHKTSSGHKTQAHLHVNSGLHHGVVPLQVVPDPGQPRDKWEATTHFPRACPISWLRLADVDGRSLSHVANLGSLYWLRGPSSLMEVPSTISTLPLSATHS